jgi:hypothetical protein
MRISVKFGAWFQAVVMTGGAIAPFLAGCRDGSIEQVIHGRASAEELGLRLEPVGDFDRNDGSSAAPDNLGRRYQETGRLLYSAFSIHNEGNAPIGVYIRPPAPEVSGLELTALLSTYFPWDYPIRFDQGNGPIPESAHFQVTHASFYVADAEWFLASGGYEKVRSLVSPTPTRGEFFHLRPGESATLRLHLKLKDETNLVPSLLQKLGSPDFLEFLAPESPQDGDLRPLRTFFFEQWFSQLSLSPSLVVHRLDRDEMTNLFLDQAFLQGVNRHHALPYQARSPIRNGGATLGGGTLRPIPPEQASRRFERLPVFTQ